MKKNNLEKIRKALWTFKQPLTKMPVNAEHAISDMFVWRNSENWKTFFELTDIAGLFIEDRDESSEERYVTIQFFNVSGKKIHEEHVQLKSNKRLTLDMSKYLGYISDEIGTFCIFHSYIPLAIKDLNSYITERGYLSYKYKDAPLRSYVHGNMDAVQIDEHKRVDTLGGVSFLEREYRIQHEFLALRNYELLFVNHTKKVQSIRCALEGLHNGEFKEVIEQKVVPMGVAKFELYCPEACSYRVIIMSNMVMARPLVCRIHDDKLDVFHG
jgi:hypothetical protein